MENSTKVIGQTKDYKLTDNEIELIEFCRGLEHGSFKLYIEYGQPLRYEKPLMGRKFGKHKIIK